MADSVLQQDAVGRVDSQVQGEDAVTAVDGLQRFGVNALFRERLSEEEEGLTLADGVRQRDVVNRVDGQVQREDAVTAVNGLECFGVNALLGERLVEEKEGVALTDGVRQRDAVGRVDR